MSLSSFISRVMRSTALGLSFVALTAAAAPAEAPLPASQIPISHFFSNATFSGAILSPNAKFLAVRFGAENQRDRLAVVDLINNTVKVVGQMAAFDVTTFQWVNDNRLIFDSSDRVAQPGQSAGSAGLFAVNRDGTYQRSFGQIGSLTGAGPQDSDMVYIAAGESYKRELKHVNLMTLDTMSGKTNVIQRPGASNGWLLDQKGLPRVSSTFDERQQHVHYLDQASGKWRKLASSDAFFPAKDAFTPIAVGPDGNLFVLHRGDKDKAGLHVYDVTANKLNPTPLVALEDYDFNGGIIATKDKLLGIRYLSDAWSTLWFDEAMKATQAKVDALLPDTVNLISLAVRPEMPWVLVYSYSDRDPGGYALYNTETGKLNPVGQSRPQLKPAQMAEQEVLRITARDGLVIPTYMTVPAGVARKALPMVVLVHGGPYVRGGEWGWNANSQFLASRGYVVVEPEFRGSMGFGQKHYEAGWKQWGLNMQNDIADVTRWAIAQGIADPKRICIAGASYGGYATLLGMIKDPDLYQCGINWIGVTDLTLLHSGDSSFISDMGDAYKKFGFPILIGDPVKDADRFKATSAVEQAALIKKPLLMAYGVLDQRVPYTHGKKFLDAVQPGNKDVEMVKYDDEGHGWFYMKNRVDFWSRVEKFLDKHIGKK